MSHHDETTIDAEPLDWEKFIGDAADISHTVSHHDVTLRLALDADKTNPIYPPNPEDWNWGDILGERLRSYESVEVLGYVQHKSTFEVNDIGEIIKVTTSELINDEPNVVSESLTPTIDALESVIDLAWRMISDNEKPERGTAEAQFCIGIVEEHLQDLKDKTSKSN